MYAQILKTSEGARKAWEKRKGNAKAMTNANHKDLLSLSGERKVGNTGLSENDLKLAVRDMKKQVTAGANAAEQEFNSHPAIVRQKAAASKLFGKHAEHEHDDAGIGGVSMDNAGYAGVSANAKKLGYSMTTSKNMVGGGPGAEGSMTDKIPQKIHLAHSDGHTVTISHNRDHGDSASMDVKYKFPSKKVSKTDELGSVANALGARY
jgi:hypothetical protein